MQKTVLVVLAAASMASLWSMPMVADLDPVVDSDCDPKATLEIVFIGNVDLVTATVAQQSVETHKDLWVLLPDISNPNTVPSQLGLKTPHDSILMFDENALEGTDLTYNIKTGCDNLYGFDTGLSYECGEINMRGLEMTLGSQPKENVLSISRSKLPSPDASGSIRPSCSGCPEEESLNWLLDMDYLGDKSDAGPTDWASYLTKAPSELASRIHLKAGRVQVRRLYMNGSDYRLYAVGPSPSQVEGKRAVAQAFSVTTSHDKSMVKINFTGLSAATSRFIELIAKSCSPITVVIQQSPASHPVPDEHHFNAHYLFRYWGGTFQPWSPFRYGGPGDNAQCSPGDNRN